MTTTRSPLAFTRSDFVLSYILGGVVLLGAVGLAVVAPVIEWASGSPLTAPVQLWDRLPLPAPDGVALGADSAVAVIPDAPAWAHLLVIGRGVLLVAILALVLIQLFGLLRSVQAGHPFTGANVGRLRVMAVALLAGPVLVGLFDGFANAALLRLVDPGRESLWLLAIPVELLMVIAFGLLLACLAHVFGRGVELERDVEGLV